MKTEVTIVAVKGENCEECIFKEQCDMYLEETAVHMSQIGLPRCEDGYYYRIKQPIGKNNKRSNFLKALDRVV